MKLGVHLPLMEFGGEGLSRRRLMDAVDAARESGLAAVSTNDHFVFTTPWLDGPTALAAVIERSGDMTLATTISLAALRGPVSLAKTLAALDLLSEGRLIAGVGPGSTDRDYAALGIPFEERWKRFDESVPILRALLRGEQPPAGPHFAAPDRPLAPRPHRGEVPLWIGSWGSDAGLARVARLADGWLASAYNTTPDRFGECRERLAEALGREGRRAEGFPNAIATAWLYVTEDRAEAERVLTEVLAPMVNRPVEALRELSLPIGPAEVCAERLRAFADAGAERVFVWPLGDDVAQLELFAGRVAPLVRTSGATQAGVNR